MALRNYTRVRPSFWTGLARALDLGNTLDDMRDQGGTTSAREQIARELLGDSRRVSADLERAYGQERANLLTLTDGES